VSGYEVQDVVNQQDQIISATTTQPPPSTLAAPTLAASVVNSTTAKLTWNSVSGAQGYNVYLVNGSSTQLLGTVSASTTAVNVTGLTPGASESFMVTAFNATSTANSNVATVQMPAAAGLAAPQVTATALSSTTALLEWNSVAGAQGYRIYLVEGGQRFFLGSVRRWTTAVEITGMSPGTSYSFQVEAFNFNSVADSAVVTVQTPQAASAFNRLPAWARVAAQMGDPAGPSEGLTGELHHRHHFR
jgi:fibronectin type 3 domain-containing protein